MEWLDLDADRALFDGKILGIIATCYENERPLQGLAGLLDWRFQGAISNCLQAGVITGRPGECAYLPVIRGGRVYHLLLVGAGLLPDDHSRRKRPPKEAWVNLSKNLSSLRLERIGISCSDFGGVDVDYFKSKLEGLSLWIVQ